MSTADWDALRFIVVVVCGFAGGLGSGVAGLRSPSPGASLEVVMRRRHEVEEKEHIGTLKALCAHGCAAPPRKVEMCRQLL